jgi:sortase A
MQRHADRTPARHDPGVVLRRLFGLMVLVAGLFLLGKAVAVRAEGLAWQAAESVRFDLLRAAPTAITPPRPGEALARLRVDRLGLEVMVAEGSDGETLALGPGHMRKSALPGAPGNCIIAGHRDAEFRRLRDIRAGDLIDLNGWSGAARYRVTAIRIVDRDETALLAQSDEARLTLVTCYPFYYFGPAPQRFVVQAELVEAEVAGRR